ncbi:precorrin-6Y C5/15-methyltransferase (decarboxylating) [Synechococcus sp. MVIR-18-1]|nr:precorrin-6Y C5/15-methyltransferase (decarboxylating) [Synechococcus sp. MVIR-18-1]
MEQAHLLAAPKRMLPALQQWRTSEPNQRCIASDHPIALIFAHL